MSITKTSVQYVQYVEHDPNDKTIIRKIHGSGDEGQEVGISIAQDGVGTVR